MRTCSICKHPKAWAIDQAIHRGLSLRTIAVLAGVSKDSLQRHKRHFTIREARRLSRSFIPNPVHDSTNVASLLAANWQSPDVERAMQLSEPTEGESE